MKFFYKTLMDKDICLKILTFFTVNKFLNFYSIIFNFLSSLLFYRLIFKKLIFDLVRIEYGLNKHFFNLKSG